MATKRQVRIWMLVAVGAACLASIVIVISNDDSVAVLQGADATLDSEYSYGDESPGVTHDMEAVPSPREKLSSSAQQWPQSPKDQMTAMQSRLRSVVDAISGAAGTHVIAFLGETKLGATANGDGTITVDMSSLWTLSEDALAALIAHEVAHEVLAHQPQIDRLEEGPRDAAFEHRMRSIELAADELAGRLVAKAQFRADGFVEMLDHLSSAERTLPSVKQYCSRQQRRSALEEAFAKEHSALMERTPLAARSVSAASQTSRSE